MHKNDKICEKAVLVGVHTDNPDKLMDTTDETMDELCELANTAGAEVVGQMVQNRPYPDKATYIGEGKLQELKNACETFNATMVIFDDGLTGSQIRNIEDALGGDITVIDRNVLILDIFAQRAKTKEGKIQVELAQLKYMLPRLLGLGVKLSRLGGGIGTRGPGETKLESDRRHIRRRIEALEEELAEISKHRNLLRARREKEGTLTVAIVGYTNAGKSSLLNKLTGANITARDRLFETLDPTTREIVLSDNRHVLLTDTVGFIRRLPHQFIKAFKSTLEEASVADVLIHVIDSSSPYMNIQIEVCLKLLEEIGCIGKPIIAALNKCDKEGANENILPKSKSAYTDVIKMSVKNGEGIEELLSSLFEALPGKKIKIKVLIPYQDGSVVSSMHKNELVLSEECTQDGTEMELMVDEAVLQRIKKYEIL